MYFLVDQIQEFCVQGGLEIPYRYTFHGEKSMINEAEMLFNRDSNQTLATLKQEAKVTDSSKPSQKDCICTPITNLQAACNKTP